MSLSDQTSTVLIPTIKSIDPITNEIMLIYDFDSNYRLSDIYIKVQLPAIFYPHTFDDKKPDKEFVHWENGIIFLIIKNFCIYIVDCKAGYIKSLVSNISGEYFELLDLCSGSERKYSDGRSRFKNLEDLKLASKQPQEYIAKLFISFAGADKSEEINKEEIKSLNIRIELTLRDLKKLYFTSINPNFHKSTILNPIIPLDYIMNLLISFPKELCAMVLSFIPPKKLTYDDINVSILVPVN